jgi:MscS family membrane protein
MPARALTILLLLIAFVLPRPYAQVPLASKQPAEAQPEESDDPLGRSNPRGTVVGFIKAAERGDYEEASQYLDTKQKGELAAELAQHLKSILDQEAQVDLSKLSRRPEGNPPGSQNPNRYVAGTITSSSGNVQIGLERVKRGDNPPIWLFSKDTLKQIPDLYQDIDATSSLENSIPDWLKIKVLRIPLWRWISFLIAVPIVLLLGSLLVGVLGKILALVAHRVWGQAGAARGRGLVGPLRLVMFGILFIVNADYSRTLLSRSFWGNLGKVLIIFGATWLLMKVFGLASAITLARLEKRQAFDKIAMAGLLGRLAQIGALTVGIFVVLHLAGVNLTAALTGLGIGGLAVAFAAQKTLENLFGGIMIISDQPVRIGDACKIGDVVGNVVDIGLRSTRIRTTDRTVVTIPNGQLAMSNLENYTLRDKFWFHPIISLSQQTTMDQMQTVLTNIRELLEKHPKVESSTVRVRFIGVRTASLDVEIFAYVIAVDYNAFLAVQEELLLQVLSIVESAGTALALPTQVTHLVSDANAQGLEAREPAVALDRR